MLLPWDCRCPWIPCTPVPTVLGHKVKRGVARRGVCVCPCPSAAELPSSTLPGGPANQPEPVLPTLPRPSSFLDDDRRKLENASDRRARDRTHLHVSVNDRRPIRTFPPLSGAFVRPGASSPFPGVFLYVRKLQREVELVSST